MTEFNIVSGELVKYIGHASQVEIPMGVHSVYGNAFSTAAELRKLTLSEDVKYCVCSTASLQSPCVNELVIKNALYSGRIDVKDLPSLKKLAIVDSDTSRINNARAITVQVANLPDTVDVYFPNVNMFACNRDTFDDIKICAHYLRCKHLYSPPEQEHYDKYILVHSGRMLSYLAEQKNTGALRGLLPLCQQAAYLQLYRKFKI